MYKIGKGCRGGHAASSGHFILATALCLLLDSYFSKKAWAADSYQVNYGATVDITEHGVCKRVTNNHASSAALFVPTKTAPEWASFYGATIAGVTIADCGLIYVTSTTSTGNTITIPASAQAGDLAILFEYSNQGNPPEVNPAGWTAVPGLDYTAFFNDRYQVHYKVLAGGDPGTVVTGLAGTERRKTMYIFRTATGKTVTFGGLAQNINAGNPPSQTIMASGQTPPLIVLGWAVDGDISGNGAFSTASPAFDATVASPLLTGYKIYNTGPVNHTVDMNDLGTANWVGGFYVRVNDSGGGGGGNQTFSSNGTFVVPTYTTLTVQVWGAGAGGYDRTCSNGGGSGGQSRFNSPTPLIANGGNFLNGGTASGGTTNTTGGLGGSNESSGDSGYFDDDFPFPLSCSIDAGGGGSAPGGGGDGGNGGNVDVDDDIGSEYDGGDAGDVPGGGGGGEAEGDGDCNEEEPDVFYCEVWCEGGCGGGSGGYTTRTFTAGQLTVGASIAVTVGSGGSGSGSGNDGADGQVYITWN